MRKNIHPYNTSLYLLLVSIFLVVDSRTLVIKFSLSSFKMFTITSSCRKLIMLLGILYVSVFFARNTFTIADGSIRRILVSYSGANVYVNCLMITYSSVLVLNGFSLISDLFALIDYYSVMRTTND